MVIVVPLSELPGRRSINIGTTAVCGIRAPHDVADAR